MRIPAILVAVLLCTACAAPRTVAPQPIVASDAASGVMALSAVGARNVRVLYVRPPSIVLLREVFVPAGEHVIGVHFADTHDALIVDTDAERLALDTHTWRLAQIHQEARDVAAGVPHARRRG
jgi:hypothetical protein